MALFEEIPPPPPGNRQHDRRRQPVLETACTPHAETPMRPRHTDATGTVRYDALRNPTSEIATCRATCDLQRATSHAPLTSNRHLPSNIQRAAHNHAMEAWNGRHIQRAPRANAAWSTRSAPIITDMGTVGTHEGVPPRGTRTNLHGKSQGLGHCPRVLVRPLEHQRARLGARDLPALRHAS